MINFSQMQMRPMYFTLVIGALGSSIVTNLIAQDCGLAFSAFLSGCACLSGIARLAALA
jgi:hypothetical protein